MTRNKQNTTSHIMSLKQKRINKTIVFIKIIIADTVKFTQVQADQGIKVGVICFDHNTKLENFDIIDDQICKPKGTRTQRIRLQIFFQIQSISLVSELVTVQKDFIKKKFISILTQYVNKKWIQILI